MNTKRAKKFPQVRIAQEDGKKERREYESIIITTYKQMKNYEKNGYFANQKELGNSWYEFLKWESFGQAVKEVSLAMILVGLAIGFVWALNIIF
jgi:hypothetical protein